MFLCGFFQGKKLSRICWLKPDFIKRYIDDIVGTIAMQKEALQNYIDSFNSFNDAIGFMSEICEESITSLDSVFNIDSSGSSSSVYYKPTDLHAYLRYDSHHPTECKDSIPYSQFLRIRRFCDKEEDFTHQIDKMADFFSSRGYPQSIIDAAEIRVKDILRSESPCPITPVGRSLSLLHFIPWVWNYRALSTKMLLY